MIWRRAPAVVQQLHSSELLQNNAAPVCRRTGRLKSAFAFSAVLVAQHTHFAFLVPAQPVRAKQPRESVIAGGNRTLARHGGPDQPVNLFHCLDLRLNNTPDSHVNASQGVSSNRVPAFYDPVVLGDERSFQWIYPLPGRKHATIFLPAERSFLDLFNCGSDPPGRGRSLTAD
jgi:hypothetical protein